MVDLNGTVTALAETNVNWNNFKFRDDWGALLQQKLCLSAFCTLLL